MSEKLYIDGIEIENFEYNWNEDTEEYAKTFYFIGFMKNLIMFYLSILMNHSKILKKQSLLLLEKLIMS
jgi:hypothetical protein